MNKQIVNFVQFNELYKILNEIRDILSFDPKNYKDINDFLKDFEKDKNLNNTTIITKSDNNLKLSKVKIDARNILNLNHFPDQLFKILDKINIQLIKQKYNFQSKIDVKNYNLNLNSRTISKNKDELKLTEKEVDIILFLKKQNEPKKIEILQKEIWKYSPDLETHTVETHIYRLRKKIKEKFRDDHFILSFKEGYLIE
tara:strand:+ start:996 stop:1592 length:597 start_codon:yes stop_codon:yes gene_type:complete